MENERYLFVTSDDNVSRIIDFIWPVYKEIFGIEKMYGKQCIIYNDAELKHVDTELGTDSAKIKLALKEPCMWNEMIFQLAYEMCYCILQEYKRQWKKERFLSWYEETVCNAFSCYILKYSMENWNKCDLSNINPEYSKYIDEYLQMKMKEEGTEQQENINKLYDIFCDNPKAVNSLEKYYDYINEDNSSLDVQRLNKDIGISIPETLSKNESLEESLPHYMYEICKKYWNEKFSQFSACVAIVFSMALWIIKGIWYTYMAGRFSVYKIDKCYIDMNNDSVFLQTIQLIAYLTIGIFSNYVFYKILKTKKKKVRNIVIFVAIEVVILFFIAFVSNDFTVEQLYSQLTPGLVVTVLILYIIVVVLINSLVFENVPGLLSAKPGDTPITELIQKQFSEAGYAIISDLKNAVVDVSDYGVPQKRKRVIILGLRKEIYGDQSPILIKKFYEEILPSYKLEKKKTLRDAIGDLPGLYPAEKVVIYDGRKTAHTIASTVVKNHISRYHNQRDIQLFSMLAADIESGANQYLAIEARKALYTQHTGKTSNIHKYNVLKWNEPSTTIPAHLCKDGLRHIHPDSRQARTITVREAARIQTFPDDYEFIGAMTDQYKMIGNAVPPEFARRLALAVHQLIFED